MIAGMGDSNSSSSEKAPAWLEQWTSGDWREAVKANPEHEAAHLRWWLERPRSVQQLMIRFPAGTVVFLKPGVIVMPVTRDVAIPIAEIGTRPLWAGGRWGIVVGHVEPNEAAPEGGLILNDMPRPNPGEGWVQVGDLERVEGYLRGYGPEQAREHIRGLLRLMVELMGRQASAQLDAAAEKGAA